jgi:hypothetical protein
MSDNLRRYRAIREALTQCYPGEISGRMAQHLTTLTALISGIVGSRSSQMPSIATKIPDRAKLESWVKRLSRWLGNDEVKEEIYFLAEDAIKYYQKRFRIETFFSDQKSRGFNIHKSHLEDCQRLSLLLIASCLAYIWIVYLGSLCKSGGWQDIIHCRSRCDLSLF